MTLTTARARRLLNRRYEEERLITDKSGVTKGITWRPDGFPLMQSVLSAGAQGDATITHFKISEEEANSFNLSYLFTPGGGMFQVQPGKYVRLHVGECVVDNLMMSDTPMERRTNWEIRHYARGHVLIAGLGIGMIIHPLLDPKRGSRQFRSTTNALPNVNHVTVIEKNPNVIALVKPSLERYGNRIEIIEADIFDWWPPGLMTYDTIYFDIWPHMTQDNLPEIAKLHQRWKSRLNRAGPEKPWMSSWAVEHLRSMRDEDRRSNWW